MNGTPSGQGDNWQKSLIITGKIVLSFNPHYSLIVSSSGVRFAHPLDLASIPKYFKWTCWFFKFVGAVRSSVDSKFKVELFINRLCAFHLAKNKSVYRPLSLFYFFNFFQFRNN